MLSGRRVLSRFVTEVMHGRHYGSECSLPTRQQEVMESRFKFLTYHRGVYRQFYVEYFEVEMSGEKTDITFWRPFWNISQVQDNLAVKSQPCSQSNLVIKGSD